MTDSISARPSGWQIASRAWRSVFQAMARMPVLFVSAFLLFLLMHACSIWLHRSLLRNGPGWGSYAVAVTQNIVSSLLTAPVAVAVHRWVLLNDIQPGLSWKPVYTRLFFFWALALHLLYMLMNLPIPLLISRAIRAGVTGWPFRSDLILLSFLPVLIAAVVSAYLALVFPDVAIGESSASWIARVKASVARLRGNFWLLVRAAILAFLPVIAINVITTFTVIHFYSLYPVSRYPFGPAVVGQALASSVMVLFSIGIAAATVSWLYSWARIEKAEVTGG